MFHYLFTNDLRISNLDKSLKQAGVLMLNGEVPSAEEDKSKNNNINTLAFYFNIHSDTNCAISASSGQVRKVVLNFIKKFQYPNLRTNKSYIETINDGITIAPMRTILKLLFIFLWQDGEDAFITRNEIRDFIFYNSSVAKTEKPDYFTIYQSIKEFRKTGKLPETIELCERFWQHEERQLREMMSILIWSGFVDSDKSGMKYKLSGIRDKDEYKAALLDIILECNFWKGTAFEEYKKYMDI